MVAAGCTSLPRATQCRDAGRQEDSQLALKCRRRHFSYNTRGTRPRSRHWAHTPHPSHGIWSPSTCGGLGVATARVHWYKFGIDSPDLLSVRTGYGAQFIERALHRMHLEGLLGVKAVGEKLLDVFETTSNTLGVACFNARRAARHLVDRELFTWWNEEHQWRTARGKKRGPRRTTFRRQARVRYGRFPTRSNGRADYPPLGRSSLRSVLWDARLHEDGADTTWRLFECSLVQRTEGAFRDPSVGARGACPAGHHASKRRWNGPPQSPRQVQQLCRHSR